MTDPTPQAGAMDSGVLLELAADSHPWSFIAEELLARGWSIEDLAIRMAIPDYDHILQEITKNGLVLDLYRHVGPIRSNCTIGPVSGPAIARAFGVNEDFILNLERAWKENAARAHPVSALSDGGEG